jgi:uncharacterized protein (DUF433 family)
MKAAERGEVTTVGHPRNLLKSLNADRARGEAMIDWSQCADAESIPGKMSGAWCLKGTRIRCEDITGQFDAGVSAEEIAGPDIYDLPLDVVRRILAFAGRKYPPPLMFGEGEPTALLLAIILDRCGGDGILRSWSEPGGDPDAIYSYNIPANADAMICLHEEGYIEITKQDGARIWAKVLPQGRTLIDSLRAAQERKEAASWRHRPAHIP